MTVRTTESLRLNKDAVLPVILALIAVILSMAGWWLAWLSGLVVLVLWLLLMCIMDYVPRVDIILITVMVCASIAALAELFVVANVNDAASCGNSDKDCKYLSPALKMILAAIATVLWCTIIYFTWGRYRAKTMVTTSTTTATTRATNPSSTSEPPPV